MSPRESSYCDGLSRRNVLQAALAGTIGLSLPDVLRLRAQAAARGLAPKDTAVIYIEMAGGPTQHETYDPKPLAPVEYRGPLSAISTRLPGVQFSESMSEQAKVADKLAIIRSVHHTSSSHGNSSHLTQTGYYLRNVQNRDNEMPSIGAVTARVRGSNAHGMPAFVSLPRSMRFGGSAWLGKAYEPFTTVRNASDSNFEVPNISLLEELNTSRLSDRRQLLKEFDATRKLIDNGGVADAMDAFTREAFEMITGDAARQAFDIGQESDATRERYGLNATGQNVLLARRLVERGVTFATIRTGSWDNHQNIADRIKSVGSDYDRAVAALVSDLHERGLDKKVMVVGMGEFGRTPRINRNAGRDHWGQVMSVLLAGGGIKAGQIVGATDSTGSVPVEAPYRPENVLALLYEHLGIDTSMTFDDNAGRPRYVLEERGLIRELV